MIKIEYEAPELKIVKFETQDCITTSGDDMLDIGDLPNGNE